MNKIFNFGAGPSTLPSEVVKKAAELFQNSGNGIGVAELSHRSKEYLAIHQACIQQLRSLLEVPNTHEVLLVPGGATTQFALIPMNFLSAPSCAAYVITGSWSAKAAEHAEKVASIVQPVTDIRGVQRWNALKECPDGMPTREWVKQKTHPNPDIYDYVHITSNNTIRGSQYPLGDDWAIPKSLPVVADCSSDILSRKIDWSQHYCVYAGAQKNLGIAGVSVVIVNKDWLYSDRGRNHADRLPPMMAYRTHAEKESLYNTPPTFPIVVMKLMLDWVEKHGGVANMEKIARERSFMIYDALRTFPDCYEPVIKDYKFQSPMNVTWTIKNDEDGTKTESFLKNAALNGLVGLKGHRSVGGIRASMYNAMPFDGSEKLANFLYRWVQS